MMIDKSAIIRKMLCVVGKRYVINYEDGRNVEVCAVLDNTWDRNKTRFETVSTKIGKYRRDYYVYFGPADVDITALSERDYLSYGNRRYKFVLSEPVVSGSTIQYYTGIVKSIEEDDGNVFI